MSTKGQKHRYDEYDEQGLICTERGQKKVWLRVPAIYFPADSRNEESYFIPDGEADSCHIKLSSWIEEEEAEPVERTHTMVLAGAVPDSFEEE